jgi:hypothetical protein
MAKFYLPMSNRLGNTLTTISILTTSSTRIPIFLRLIVGLFSCFTAFCVIAIGYGHVASSTDPITRIGLERCARTFCFRNALPGLTSWSSAKASFALLKNKQMSEHQIYIPIGLNGGAALYHSADGRTVTLVYIAVPSDIPVKVGGIVNRFGPPCALTLPLYLEDPTLTLYYPRMRVIARLSGNHLEISTPVEYIALGDPAELFNMPSDLCRDFDLKHRLPTDTTRTWQGFMFVSSYLGKE